LSSPHASDEASNPSKWIHAEVCKSIHQAVDTTLRFTSALTGPCLLADVHVFCISQYVFVQLLVQRDHCLTIIRVKSSLN